MGIQINGNTDNISAVDGGLTVSDLELNQTGVSTFHSHLHVADQIINLGDANTKIRFPAADSITAETGGSERLRIDSSGRIGVGVVPTAQYAHTLIQIRHQATLGANAALSATGQTFLTHNLYFDTGGTLKVFNTSNANEGAIFRLVDGQLLFSNSAATTGTPTVTERFRITSTGEIKQYGFTGSSDTSADDLVLGNTTGRVIRGMTIWSNSSKIGALVFADNDSNFRGAVQYIHNGDSLRFLTAGSERLRIDSSGRVLIGTTDPGGGNADDLTVATSGNTGITIRSGTSNTGNIFFSDATSGAAQYAGAIEFHHSDNSLNLNVSNTNRLRIQSNGKFGLNRSAPQYAMHLSPADGDTRIDIHMTNSTTGHNNNDGVQVGYQNSAGAYIWNFENTPIYF